MTRTLRTLAPVALAAALLAGCSSGSDSGGSSESGGSDGSAFFSRPGGSDAITADAPAEAADADLKSDLDATAPRALIKKGNVSLRADDVGAAQVEVQKVADRYAGQVSSEKTQSDDDGRPTYTRMVLRVPSDDFSKAVAALKDVGELESSATNEDDVTDEVIDVRTRLRVQQRSIARITVLFDRAESIRDIMAIEGQLSQRQADLESLQRRADHLANQTSLSTIVVSIDRTPAAAKPKQDDTGFLAGLGAGWGALTAFAVGLATAAGAVLPWIIVVAVVGMPVLLLVRALRRRTPASAASGGGSSETQSSE